MEENGITVGQVLRAVWRFLGSYALAIMILLMLLALTYAGTLAQRDASIHDVQEKYFDSYLVDLELPLGIPIVVPGANLLLSVLFVNLLVGGMIRLRRDWRRAGVLVIHIGIATLLLGNLVEFLYSEKGSLPLREGEQNDYYYSYTEWELAVLEPQPASEIAPASSPREIAHVIDGDHFENLEKGESVRFESPRLPFALVLSGFLPNCRPQLGPNGNPVLAALPPHPTEASRNDAGLTVRVVDDDSPARRETVLWGDPDSPAWVFTADGRTWGVQLRKKRYPLPYSVQLRDVVAEHYPGTSTPLRYASDVTRYENNIANDVHISMNSPMREGGYIFYQSGYIKGNPATGGREVSIFSVSHNPSDRIPVVACAIIALGLVVHFLMKLVFYIEAEVARRERLAHAAS